MIRRFKSLSSATRIDRPSSRSVGISGVARPTIGPSSVSWNVLPGPSNPGLRTATVPPIISARRRLITSPSPVPP